MVSTGTVSNVAKNSATAEGTIVDVGEGITEHGHVYGTSSGVSLGGSNTETKLGSKGSTGSYSSQLTSLNAGTTYYIRAYVIGSSGTQLGKEISFKTSNPEVPTLTTTAASGITTKAVSSGGDISTDGGATVTARGICFATSAEPTINDTKTTDGSGTGSFSSNLDNLLPGTTYYIRAYATNVAGTGYGNELTFTTKNVQLPFVEPTQILGIYSDGASLKSIVTSDGGGTVIVRGFCWGINDNPDLSGTNASSGSGTGEFLYDITGLSPGKLYHVRAYATNSAGTAFSTDNTFTTLTVVPTVITIAPASVTASEAESGGTVTADGGASVINRGVCYSLSSGPTTGDSKTTNGTGTGIFSSILSNLNPLTTYYLRAYATNSAGTGYGEQFSFTTTAASAVLPIVTTTAISAVSSSSAASGGNVTSEGSSPVTSKGICWSTNSNPTISDFLTNDGTGAGSYTSNMINLNPGTVYHVRAYATSSAGTAYGADLTLTTNAVLPAIQTSVIADISTNKASSGGTISSDGGALITIKGVCWSTSANPTTSDSKTNDGTGTDTFVSSIINLNPGTLYHVRAFATNSVGTSYGADVSFTTSSASLATLTTTVASAVTSTSATSGGDITSDGGGSITVRGVCWDITTNPTTGDNRTLDGPGTGSYSSSLTGISPNTKYYVRAYATNSAGTAYGNEITFTTSPGVPSLTITTAPSFITATTTSSGGAISSDGGSAVTARGVVWGTGPAPTSDLATKTTDGSGTGSFVSNLTGLTQNTLYYLRSYATNSVGTGYGPEISFSTLQLPTVTTTAATAVSSFGARMYGVVNAHNSSTNVEIQYGLSTAYDLVLVPSQSPVQFNADVQVYVPVSGLNANTTYHYRIRATSDAGTVVGNDMTFTTPTMLVDVDANNYHTVYIGTQLWMWENLRVTHYRDGSPINYITDNSSWSTQTVGAYTWYDNDVANKPIYGGLYNYYTTIENRNLCPTGWHVPTDAEWTTMANYVISNGYNYDGATSGNKIAKALASTSSWTSSSNIGSVGNTDYPDKRNATGFTYLPSGFRGATDGFFYIKGDQGYTWSTSQYDVSNSLHTSISYAGYTFYSDNSNKKSGFSVRCLQGEGQVLPAVTTTSISGINSTGATSGGNVTSNGNSTITARGVCWSTSTNPTVDLTTKTDDGSGTGSYTSIISGLTPNTTYYVRAYSTNSVGTVYGNQVSFLTNQPGIGDTYQGGKVAYIFQSGDLGYIAGQVHGIIAAANDQSTGAEWGCYGSAVSPSTNTAIGWGNANTVNITDWCSTAGIAARLCIDLVISSYSDWYLPSKDELNKLYINKTVIGGFSNNWYWSSSQLDANYAWGMDFNSGTTGTNTKGFTDRVRAIRYF